MVTVMTVHVFMFWLFLPRFIPRQIVPAPTPVIHGREHPIRSFLPSNRRLEFNMTTLLRAFIRHISAT